MRLFIAVNIPDEIREEIWEKAALLRERRYAIRWVSPEAMHITLKFLGEVSAHREEEIKRALEASVLGVSPFILRLGGFGAFPDTRRAKVIWVGCKPPPALKKLQQQIETNASDIGFDRDKRSFHPHVTLGRLRRGALSERLAGLSVVLDRLDFESEYPVKSVELMQSELSPAGARYTVLASIGLSG